MLLAILMLSASLKPACGKRSCQLCQLLSKENKSAWSTVSDLQVSKMCCTTTILLGSIATVATDYIPVNTATMTTSSFKRHLDLALKTFRNYISCLI